MSRIAVWSPTGRVENSASEFLAAELAFAQALEHDLCSTPEAGSSRPGGNYMSGEHRPSPSISSVFLVTRVVVEVTRTYGSREGGGQNGRMFAPQVWKIG